MYFGYSAKLNYHYTNVYLVPPTVVHLFLEGTSCLTSQSQALFAYFPTESNILAYYRYGHVSVQFKYGFFLRSRKIAEPPTIGAGNGHSTQRGVGQVGKWAPRLQSAPLITTTCVRCRGVVVSWCGGAVVSWCLAAVVLGCGGGGVRGAHVVLLQCSVDDRLQTIIGRFQQTTRRLIAIDTMYKFIRFLH